MEYKKYGDFAAVYAKMKQDIPAKELNTFFPNGAISFAIQLNRGNVTAIQLYQYYTSI